MSDTCVTGEPCRCRTSESLRSGARQCAVCWRYKLESERCPSYKPRGYRLVRDPKNARKVVAERYVLGVTER